MNKYIKATNNMAKVGDNMRYEKGEKLCCDKHKECQDNSLEKHEEKHCKDDCLKFEGRICREDKAPDEKCGCHKEEPDEKCGCRKEEPDEKCGCHKEEPNEKVSCCRCNSEENCENLRIAHATGQQVSIVLKSGSVLEGCIVEKLFPTSFRVWLEPAEPVEPGEDIDKAIVAIHAVDFILFSPEGPEQDFTPFFDEPNDRCLEGIREALGFALETNQSVNVNLNIETEEPTRDEGIIKRVGCETFTILSEETNTRVTYDIERLEYVEYS